MSIYEKLVNYFSGPPTTPETPTPQAEEKSALSNSLAWVSDGTFSRVLLNKLDKAYSTNYVIHKCINILSFNLSRLPLRIYRNDEPLPLDFILPNGFDIRNPHPRMSMSRLLYECGVYYWYKGEFMSQIDLETPFSLEPVNPDLMKINTQDSGIITSWKHDNKIIVPAEELIYAYMMNPDINSGHKLTDSNRRLSPVDVVEKEILNYASGREFNTQFFKNFAQLGITLQDNDPTAPTSIDDRREIARAIDNQIEAGNAYRTRVLPQGLSVADTKGMSMREMEFAQSLKDIRDIILGIYGVPRSVFGITNDVGLSQGTVEVEKRLMWTDTIKPAAYMIQEAFNQTLMKRYFPGFKVYFDYSDIDVLQDNMTDKIDLALKYQNLGYTTEEINSMLDLGMEESTDPRLNERFIPNSLVPYSDFSPVEEEPTKSISDEEITKALDILTDETKSRTNYRYINRYNRIQRSIEKDMNSKIRGYFSKQLGKVLALVKSEKAITKLNTTTLLASIMNLLQEEKNVLANKMSPVYEDGSLKASELAVSVLGSTVTPAADEEIVKNLSNKIGRINNHTYRMIRTQVKDSVNAGETIADLSKRIQTIYKTNAARARTIARTESGFVLQQTTDKRYREAGVTKKQWAATKDGRTRDSHYINDSIGTVDYNYVYPNGQAFPLDGNGGAAENVHCRCTHVPVIEEE